MFVQKKKKYNFEKKTNNSYNNKNLLILTTILITTYNQVNGFNRQKNLITESLIKILFSINEIQLNRVMNG